MPRKRKRNAGLGIQRKKVKAINNKSNTNADTLTFTNNNFSLDTISNCITEKSVVTDDDEIDQNSDDAPALVEQDFLLEKKMYYQMKVESFRWTVYYFFMKRHGMSPPEDVDLYTYWTGRGGIGSKVKKDLKLSRTISVKCRLLHIFEKVMECIRSGEKFHPKMVDSRGGNRKITIRLDSMEAQIIADSIESGLSQRRAWENVNRHRKENGDELVLESCVAYVLRKMKPKMVKIKKRKQGSTDPESNWAQARYAWTQQLLARFGRLPRTPLIGPIERKFDQHLLGKLDLNQIVWWDETHRKCLIGTVQNPSKDYDILFPRNNEGKFDVEGGEYTKERKSRLNVKYEKECRLGLGVGMIAPLSEDGTPLPSTGKRCHPYDYTSKVMISIEDYKRLMKVEFNRVRSLKGTNGYWYQSFRDPNIQYYQNDPVSKLKGVGKKTAELLEGIGLKTVGDLKSLTSPTDIEELPQKLTISKLTKFCTEARQAVDKDAPIGIDHRLSANPYLSKFGAEWEKHLKASATFSHSACICDYIEHIMSESERIMKGTIHENTWMVYHDALAIMTAKATKEWMAEKGYLKRWILPSEDLYNNLPNTVRKSYQGKPIGNSPEYMPLDTHLNQDIHASHDYHVVLTQDAPDDDAKKFSGSTPKRISSSYHRLTDPEDGIVPTPSRIMQDINRVLVSMEKVREARGCIIDESCRSGRRYEEKGDDDNSSTIIRTNWGGKREKKSQESYLLHLDKSNQCIHNDAILIMEEMRRNGEVAVAGHDESGNASIPDSA